MTAGLYHFFLCCVSVTPPHFCPPPIPPSVPPFPPSIWPSFSTLFIPNFVRIPFFLSTSYIFRFSFFFSSFPLFLKNLLIFHYIIFSVYPLLSLYPSLLLFFTFSVSLFLVILFSKLFPNINFNVGGFLSEIVFHFTLVFNRSRNAPERTFVDHKFLSVKFHSLRRYL